MPPKFIHDCDSCEFLGHMVHNFNSVDGGYDVWFCARCDGGSLICRYGDDGPDYASSMVSIIISALDSPAMKGYILADAYNLFKDKITAIQEVNPHRWE